MTGRSFAGVAPSAHSVQPLAWFAHPPVRASPIHRQAVCKHLWRLDDGSRFVRAAQQHDGSARRSVRARSSSPAPTTPAPPAPAQEEEETISRLDLEEGVSVRVSRAGGEYRVLIQDRLSRPHVFLHWAVDEWSRPGSESWPPASQPAGDSAVETPFSADHHSVTLKFAERTCPAKVVFVLRSGESWIKAGGGSFSATLRPPSVASLRSTILTAEASASHWSLFNRLALACELLGPCMRAGVEGSSLLLTWLRLSSLRQLDWYRNSNYQSKDIAHVQKRLAELLAAAAREAPEELSRLFARLSLAGLPRGGGNGDGIRMGILNIMRENGIREGHRPGIECRFLEQWHQKLHQNTTPEDVAICEAYIAFLESGSMADFWRVLWDQGSVSEEHLRGMTHPLTATPLHLPRLIPAMRHYAWVLKTTHAGADLDVALEMAKGGLDEDLRWQLYDILAHRHEWWVPGKIVQARHRLKQYWNRPGAPRDVLLLDIALDAYFRLCLERSRLTQLPQADLCSLVELTLDNACVAAGTALLRESLALWRRLRAEEAAVAEPAERALRASAAAEHAGLALAAFGDAISGVVQAHAEAFGAACNLDRAYVANFGEEVVRSQPAFVLSSLLRTLQPQLRAAAGLGPWQVVSRGAGVARGKLEALASLAPLQGIRGSESLVVLARALDGTEDIPEHVVAVVTQSPTDVLSHVAIRARAQKVLLATCFDAETYERLESLAGRGAAVEVMPSGDVLVSAGEAATAGESAGEAATAGESAGEAATAGESADSPAAAASAAAAHRPTLQLKRPPAQALAAPQWALRGSTPDLVGGKAAHLVELSAKLPPHLSAPEGVSLPFGTFEAALRDGVNVRAAERIDALLKTLDAPQEGIPSELAELRRAVRSSLLPPPPLQPKLVAALQAAGSLSPAHAASLGRPEGAEWRALWRSVCGVWASKWTERAWLSRRAHRIPEADLFMGVLVQPLVPADYAFVLHSADPLTGDADRLHGELVLGMGETLVGNSPGTALSFQVCGRGPDARLALASLCSKPLALHASRSAASMPALIARSDSNGEDLQAFAGAGLYESLAVDPLEAHACAYAGERLLFDPGFRRELLLDLARAGREVEAAMAMGPVDVEGVVAADGRLWIVQVRAQVA